MDNRTARAFVGRLSAPAFRTFVRRFFLKSYGERFTNLDSQAPFEDSAFLVVDEDFNGPPNALLSGYWAYCPYTVPVDLLEDLKAREWIAPSISTTFAHMGRDYFTPSIFQEDEDFGGLVGGVLTRLYVLTNLYGYSKDVYVDHLIPQVRRAAEEHGLTDLLEIGVGSPDSFFDRNPITAIEVLNQFLYDYRDGIAISIDPTAPPRVEAFRADRYLKAGVTRDSLNPVEPLTVLPTSEILREFEHNLSAGLSERAWEGFLSDHFREIFGPQYDRVETQVWLRVGEPSEPDRRIDLLLRDSVARDWDLVELKLPRPIGLWKRGIPEFRKEVYTAQHQAAHYYRLMKTDKVRRALASQGIEYYEPLIKVVVGRKPCIPPGDWQWLISVHSDLIKLLTYDDLLDEMRRRASDLIC